MKTIASNNTNDFLQILNLLNFDEQLFRKEFKKTLCWIPKRDYQMVEAWLIRESHGVKYPDLVELSK